MARVSYTGSVGTNMTGRLNVPGGGSVYQKNGVVRIFKPPSNPQSASQLTQRAYFSAATEAWGATLSQAQRDAYNAAAASGEWNFADAFIGSSKKLSGQNLFISLYLNVVAGGDDGSNVYDVPTKVSQGDAIATAAAADASAGTFTVTYTGTLESNQVGEVFATQPLSPGKSVPPGGAYRSLGPYSGASPFNIASAYVAKFGAITGATGKKVFVKVKMINTSTGQAREGGGVTVIIVA